jgi:AraC-like DNA-binding protein
MITNSTIKVSKSDLFDGILHKQAAFCDKKFPAHFHQEISIAFIEKGSEVLFVNDQKYLLPTGSIVVLPQGLVHAHEGVGNADWKYHSLYLQPDALKSILRNSNLDFEALPPTAMCLFSENYEIENLFTNTLKSMCCEVSFAANIAKIFSLLNKNEQINPPKSKIYDQKTMQEIKDFLEKNWHNKITLDLLCMKFRYEKFNLLRQFKKYAGLSPIHYLMALRIEAVKKALLSEQTLMDITYEYGFYDASHLAHSFQKYVGTTPTLYRTNHPTNS